MFTNEVVRSRNPETFIPKSLFAEAGIGAEDVRFFQLRGKPAGDVRQELKALTAPQRELVVEGAATISNGFMRRLDVNSVMRALSVYEREISSRPLTFVIPTAGAASRQFQLLKVILSHPLLKNLEKIDQVHQAASQEVKRLTTASPLNAEGKATLKVMQEVQRALPRFWKEGVLGGRYAFLEDLRLAMAEDGVSLKEAVAGGEINTVARYILNESGLNYGSLPKALMRFHSYTDTEGRQVNRLALEEHLRNAVVLMKGAPQVNVHFILSEEHETPFAKALTAIKNSDSFKRLLKSSGYSVQNLNVTWDFQAPNTDSLSLMSRDRMLARDIDGRPLFRKAGHGSLLPNFSNLPCDGMWTQNVDNALYENPQIRELVLFYKKVMAGLGMDVEAQAHRHVQRLRSLEAGGVVDWSYALSVVQFCREELLVELPASLIEGGNSPQVQRALLQILQRPIVVAGYVPLTPGQAGGGPFVLETEVAPGLKVRKVNTVEGSEFPGGQSNPIFHQGEFFNPVNLFISRLAPDGTRYDLAESVDPTRCFVSEKTDAKGDPVLAYERPGLWNGCLARANQISLPTPSNTFSAVKDCAGQESFLAPLHQHYEGPLFTPLDDERGVASTELKNFIVSRCS